MFFKESRLRPEVTDGLANSPGSSSGVFAIAESSSFEGLGPLNWTPWSCSPFAVKLACEKRGAAQVMYMEMHYLHVGQV